MILVSVITFLCRRKSGKKNQRPQNRREKVFGRAKCFLFCCRNKSGKRRVAKTKEKGAAKKLGRKMFKAKKKKKKRKV